LPTSSLEVLFQYIHHGQLQWSLDFQLCNPGQVHRTSSSNASNAKELEWSLYFEPGLGNPCLRQRRLLGQDGLLLVWPIEDLHATSSTMVAAMLEAFFLRRAGRFNGNQHSPSCAAPLPCYIRESGSISVLNNLKTYLFCYDNVQCHWSLL
jgi:hypothetical protein